MLNYQQDSYFNQSSLWRSIGNWSLWVIVLSQEEYYVSLSTCNFHVITWYSDVILYHRLSHRWIGRPQKMFLWRIQSIRCHVISTAMLTLCSSHSASQMQRTLSAATARSESQNWMQIQSFCILSSTQFVYKLCHGGSLIWTFSCPSTYYICL